MNFIDGATLDPATPWAPKVPLAPAPTEAPAAPPEQKSSRITPETHPHFFKAEGPSASTVGDYFSTVRRRESAGNDLAWNGVAAGRYQFTPQTWLGVAAAHPELNLRPEDIWSGEKQEAAMRAHTADNARILEEHGLKADPGNLYVVHFLGSGGGPKFLKAMEVDPGANAAALFPREAKYNAPIFFEKDGRPRSLGQVYAAVTKDFGGVSLPSAQPAAQGEQPLIEGRAAEVAPAAPEGEIPPLPAGIKPIEAAVEMPVGDIPPLPAGVKPILTDAAYRQDIHKSPYEVEAERKPDDPPEGLIQQFGEAKAREMWKDPTVRESVAISNATEGYLPGGRVGSEVGNVIGAVQMPFGLAENVPGPIGQGAAEANKFLSRFGDPDARHQGTLAAQLIPIGAGAGAAARGAKSMFEEGPTFAKWAESAIEGGRSAGIAAASTPTGETDPARRAKEKLGDVAVGATTGAALGGAVPGVVGVAKWVGKELGSASGKAARKAAEELRTGVNAETGKVLTEAERAERVATEREGLEKLKAELEERATGAQEKKAAGAEAARQGVIEKHAAGPTSTPEAVGEQIHETAVKDMEALKKERSEKSGFEKAVKSDGGAPSVPTGQFIGDSKRLLATTKSNEIKDAVADFQKKLTNKASVKGQKEVQAVSIKQAREIIQDLNAKIETASPNAAHDLTALRDKFLSHLEETHPQMKAARKAYAELSRPLDVYERTGALKKAAMEDPYSGAGVMDPTRIKSTVLGRTSAGADALGRLIEKNPAIKDSVRGVFRQELFGQGAATKTPTPTQLRAFLQNNRLALQKSGFYDEFAAMHTERAAAEKTVETETAKAKEMRGSDKSETQQKIDDLAKSKKQAEALKSDFSTLDTELKAARKPTDVTRAANRTAKSMVDRGIIDQAKYRSLLDEIHDVEQKNIDHERAARLVRQIVVAAGVAGAGALGFGGYEIGHYVSHRVTPR